jgi:predicted peptidase
MRYLVHSVSFLFALTSILPVSAAPEPPRKALEAQTVKEFSFHRSESATLKYLLFLPKGYGSDSAKRWPLMLFLHGAGERGNDISKVTVHGPPKIIAQNPDFPFILVSPQCPNGEVWSKDILLGLLDEVSASLKVDLHRVYLTGLSMGGYGTWDLAFSHPERFAAIVPISGGGNLIDLLLAEGQKKEALQSLGIWAFHGAKDPIVPPDESQRLVNLLKKIGVKDVKLTLYPEAGHDAWTETYNNPQLYEWLLGHERH